MIRAYIQNQEKYDEPLDQLALCGIARRRSGWRKVPRPCRETVSLLSLGKPCFQRLGVRIFWLSPMLPWPHWVVLASIISASTLNQKMFIQQSKRCRAGTRKSCTAGNATRNPGGLCIFDGSGWLCRRALHPGYRERQAGSRAFGQDMIITNRGCRIAGQSRTREPEIPDRPLGLGQPEFARVVLEFVRDGKAAGPFVRRVRR